MAHSPGKYPPDLTQLHAWVGFAVVRIARFVHQSGVAWGIVESREGASLEDLTVAAIVDHPFGPITYTGERWALPDVRLLAPILPSKVVAIGKNYAAHAAEMGGEAPSTPMIFIKPSTSVIGTGDTIKLPADAGRVEHEAELAIVINQPAKDVPRERAMEIVLGYTCGNDVSDRDMQKSDVQYTRAKSFDSYCPLGPWIETDLDASDVAVRCLVNGEIRQDGRTRDLIHDIPTLISFITHVMTLLPGDIILTGTPAGVSPIVAGDTVTVEIEGIGPLVNTVVRR
jgi:2-keto-4-pentenoate hydratase/2-oxohepta-3-ene-1,7-dioic acid hydratase in catechol pathway